MSVHLADFAPTDLPRITYWTLDDDQAGYVSEAMTLEENQGRYDVEFLPIDTPEARRSAAEEWAGYEQAKGDVDAREQGAFAVFGGEPERTPDVLEAILGDRVLNPKGLGTHALLKVTYLDDDATPSGLFRAYIESGSK